MWVWGACGGGWLALMLVGFVVVDSGFSVVRNSLLISM
jgi:hypothetical protein